MSSTEKKSNVKSLGLKSTFVINNEVYMTSFGRGNKAVVEKKISDGESVDMSESESFSLLDISDAKINVKGKKFNKNTGIAEKPDYQNEKYPVVQQDMLGLKNKFEEKYFGKSFNDNIHIQLAYNILDIEKIIAQYTTNAVYALNNIFRVDDREGFDCIGSVSTNRKVKAYIKSKSNKNDENAEKLKEFPKLNRLGYFGNAFFYRTWDNKKNCFKKHKGNYVTELLPEEDIYSIIELMGSLRQWAFHGTDDGIEQNWIYKLEKLEKCYKDVLDSMYGDAIDVLNEDFIETNKRNIFILKSIFPDYDYSNLVKEYYEFIVIKKHKNIGFSIKKLREYMLYDTCYSSDPDKKDKKYDSVRSKLYKLIDFVIYHGYINEYSERVDSLVNQLRSCTTDEDKEKIYNKESVLLWKKYCNVINKKIAFALSSTEIGKPLGNIQKINLNDIIITDDVSYFTKLIYLLLSFIDGKEINDLLTTLINKFDNIQSFIDVLKQIDVKCEFIDDYKFFEKSKDILQELIVLNSFAKMGPIDVSAKKVMYRDALDILGMSDGTTEDDVNELLNKILCIDSSGKIIKDSSNKKKSGMRNFIANNVIESSRFRYLVRYANSKKIRKVANCEPAIRFVLDGIPDAQIIRYYDACKNISDEPIYNITEKRKYIAELIKNINFGMFDIDEKIQAAQSTEDAEKKRRYQAVIRLYLTVMYLLLKNMVNVNSRYVIGIHCLERDAELYGIDIKKDYSLLIKYLLDNPNNNKYLKKSRWHDIINQNISNSDKKIIKMFRNSVAHLNPIRNIDKNIQGISVVNGYFDLYHYLFQNAILYSGISSSSEAVKGYLSNVERYHSYNKDFVKAYCVPLAYNVVRYKNLTIDGLFDKNKEHLKEVKPKQYKGLK